MPDIALFAGPSAHGIAKHRLDAAGVRLFPPARRDDVTRLVQSGPPGVLILADGVFQVAPAVSHAELCRAIDAGWQVWGVSSLGAIRAAELRHEGMRGFGWVYDAFADAPGLHDDEACLLHFPEAPWFPVSEALVNVRCALQRRGARFGIQPGVAQAVLQVLRDQWFGLRTVDRIEALLQQHAGLSVESARYFTAWLQRHPVKTLDLLRLLRQRPWRS